MGPTRHDEIELAEAILTGIKRRPTQSFGSYFGPERRIVRAWRRVRRRLPAADDAHDAMPRRLDRFFDCLENISRRCPAGCKKQIPIGAIIVHLNDDHEWTREQVAAWLRRASDPAESDGRRHPTA